MVNFTSTINNGDMVRELNHLVQRNLDMLAALDRVDDDFGSSNGQSDAVTALRHMHEQHVDRIADTIRVLGGAPAKKTDGHQWVSQGKVVLSNMRDDAATLSAIQSEEDKLRQEYQDKLQELKSSPEAVQTIRELLEEENHQLRHLESLGKSGQ